MRRRHKECTNIFLFHLLSFICSISPWKFFNVLQILCLSYNLSFISFSKDSQQICLTVFSFLYLSVNMSIYRNANVSRYSCTPVWSFSCLLSLLKLINLSLFPCQFILSQSLPSLQSIYLSVCIAVSSYLSFIITLLVSKK